MDANALLFGHTEHAFHHASHTAHGVPRAEFEVGIVHQTIEGRCVLRRRSKEEHREFHQRAQLRLREMILHMLAQRAKHRCLQKASDHTRMRVFQPGERGAVDQLAHAQVVFDLGFRKEFVQRFGGTRFVPLEQLVLICTHRRNGHVIIRTEDDLVRRV